MLTTNSTFRPLPPSLFVAFTMMLYGLNEVLCFHRVATELDFGVLLRVVGTAAMLGTASCCVWILAGIPGRLQTRQEDPPAASRADRVAIALICGGVAAGACAAPWPLATNYAELKCVTVLVAALIASVPLGVYVTLPRRWRSLAAGMLVIGVVHAGVLGFGPRQVAFGPFPVITMVGSFAQIAHTPVDLAEPVALAADACPAEQPAGVIFVMVDTMRADSFTPETNGILADWAKNSTTFSHAYAPGSATYTAFATWLPKLPQTVDVPFPISTTQFGATLLPRLLGDDVEAEVLGLACTGEGAAFVDGLQPGALNLLYLPTAHAPYDCSDSAQSAAECYNEAVDCISSELEAVFDWAERNPDWAVVVTSDHGESLGEKHVHFHGTALWQEQIRVPLSVRAPGFDRGRVVDTPVSNGLLSGTFGCWLGGDPSLFGGTPKVLTDAPALAPLAAHNFVIDKGINPARESAVIDWPHKLIVDRDTGYERLHNLVLDPTESLNLSPTQPELADRLRLTLSELPEAPSRR